MECVANVLKGLQTSVHIGSSTTRYIYADRTYTIFPVQSLKATVWSHPEDPSVQELLLELGVLERQEPLFSLVGNMTIRTIWILWHNGNQYSRRFPLSKFHPIWIALKLFKKQTWFPTNLRKKTCTWICQEDGTLQVCNKQPEIPDAQDWRSVYKSGFWWCEFTNNLWWHRYVLVLIDVLCCRWLDNCW